MDLDIRSVLDKHKIKYIDRGASLLCQCPVHEEKTPSFNVDPIKNLFYCFGCSEGGDSILLESILSKRSIGQVLRELNPEFVAEFKPRELSWLDHLNLLTYRSDNALIVDVVRRFWPVWKVLYDTSSSRDKFYEPSYYQLEEWYDWADKFGPWQATRKIFGRDFNIDSAKDGWILNGPKIKEFFIKW